MAPRFSYGFSIRKGSVLKEFLYAFPRGHKQVWFTRDELSEDVYHFGERLKGRNQTIAEVTRRNSLFLSAAAQLKHDQLSGVASFFRRKIETRFGQRSSLEDEIVDYLDTEENRSRFLTVLRGADLGIMDLEFSEEEMPEGAIDLVKYFLEKHKSKYPNGSAEIDPKIRKIQLTHSGTDGKSFSVPLHLESSGTRRLMEFLVPILKVLDAGGTLIVDEIDRVSIRRQPYELVDLFKSDATNPRGAQIIFSTHDTNFLCCKTLRRDEIWFAEKNPSGETAIYPLTDIKTRQNDNLEKGYLEGRFGAIPFLEADLLEILGDG